MHRLDPSRSVRASDLQRRLDSAFGRPLIAVVRGVKPVRPLPDDARRITIIQPTAIGDTLLGSGVVAAVRRRYPRAAIEILHGPSNAQAFQVIDGEFATR